MKMLTFTVPGALQHLYLKLELCVLLNK